nr:hypothetical protein [Mycoplasmopsis bovis]
MNKKKKQKEINIENKVTIIENSQLNEYKWRNKISEVYYQTVLQL